ncbi:MAG: hypothetical protein AAB442_03100 [Patescibacteria group bacterium]
MIRALVKDRGMQIVGAWFIGYGLGIVCFLFLPPHLHPWVLIPLGILILAWIVLQREKSAFFMQLVLAAIIVTPLAIVFDDLSLTFFTPIDGHYQLDAYLYYACTFMLPWIAVWYIRKLHLP